MSELPAGSHTLTLKDRKKLSLTGVLEVSSFDEQMAALKTPLGNLLVQGEGLQLKQLDPNGGDVTVEGRITAVTYEEPRQAGGWLARLFR